ncbi:MAG TPA: phytanoyl-CoA dioxygenase family protein, partial [Candidatus Thermoplasmatota archaeon]|nr:phytanoyl-CoA dioxygenase family protein [Candidatus Thermoplasmatota archaeon]
LDESCVRPHNTLAPFRWDHPLTRLVTQAGRLERLRGTTGGSDLRWISGYVSTKAPASPPLWWHQDWWCWEHPRTYEPSPPQVAVLCYLSRTDPANGALRVIPGSHRQSHPLHAVLPQAHAEATHGLDESHPALQEARDQLTLALKAGDAVALDYRLLHGTHANRSAVRRDCLVANFAPSWTTLPDDIQAHLVRHPCLPTSTEDPPPGLFPTYTGIPRDLALHRHAPASFRIG